MMPDMNKCFNLKVMEKAGLREATRVFSSDEYVHYGLVSRYGDMYDLYMMLEWSTDTQHNWIVTIPRGRIVGDQFVNLRIYDGISTYDLDNRLEGKWPYEGDREMMRIVLYSLMNEGNLP